MIGQVVGNEMIMVETMYRRRIVSFSVNVQSDNFEHECRHMAFATGTFLIAACRGTMVKKR